LQFLADCGEHLVDEFTSIGNDLVFWEDCWFDALLCVAAY